MDTTSEKTVGGSDGAIKDGADNKPAVAPTAASPEVKEETKPAIVAPSGGAAPRKRRIERVIVGVVILLIGFGYFVFANYPNLVTNPIAAKPTPTTAPVVVPTAEPHATTVLTPPYLNTRTWLVKPKKTFFSASVLPPKVEVGRKDVEATLYSPMHTGDLVCMYDHTESVFLQKKADGGWTRLCDKDIPSVSPHEIRCQPYDEDKGIPIYATFYPTSVCEDGRAVTSGDYRVHVRIYTGCDIDANNIGRSCNGIVDVDSPRMTVSN